MLFGLCNALAMFMQLMNDVLRPFLDDFIFMYFDNILIFLTSWKEHMGHIKKVLEVMK